MPHQRSGRKKPVKPEAKSKTEKSGVTIDIKGVTPDTRIGELTVDQFIKLVVQLVPQLPGRAAWQVRLGATGRVLDEIRKSISERANVQRGAVGEAVRDMQLAMLKKMPDLMKQVVSEEPKAAGRKPK